MAASLTFCCRVFRGVCRRLLLTLGVLTCTGILALAFYRHLFHRCRSKPHDRGHPFTIRCRLSIDSCSPGHWVCVSVSMLCRHCWFKSAGVLCHRVSLRSGPPSDCSGVPVAIINLGVDGSKGAARVDAHHFVAVHSPGRRLVSDGVLRLVWIWIGGGLSLCGRNRRGCRLSGDREWWPPLIIWAMRNRPNLLLPCSSSGSRHHWVLESPLVFSHDASIWLGLTGLVFIRAAAVSWPILPGFALFG